MTVATSSTLNSALQQARRVSCSQLYLSRNRSSCRRPTFSTNAGVRRLSCAVSASMEKITFGANIPGYIYGAESKPAVVVIQEWWGVNDEIKKIAMHINEKKGYRVLIPDLYKGKLTMEIEEAHHLSSNLDFVAATDEIKQAVAFLKEKGAPKVGVIGFCMGGALSFSAAQHAGVDCAAPFYGTPPAVLAQPENMKVPIQGHFGRQDKIQGFSDPETATKLVDGIKAAGGDAELFIYEDAGHGFLNTLEPSLDALKTMGNPVCSQETRDLAWSRVFEFFAKHIE